MARRRPTLVLLPHPPLLSRRATKAKADPLPVPVPAEVEHASFDPTPPGDEQPPERRWWGRHLHELRWQAELARLVVDPIYRGVSVPRGDGSPVLLVPGFLAGDESLRVLGGWLERIGYDPRRSGIHFNDDCSDRTLDRLESCLERIGAETGRPAALIGHSRGAHFTKALAHRRPELVSQAISLGAGLDTRSTSACPPRRRWPRSVPSTGARPTGSPAMAASRTPAAVASRATTPLPSPRACR